MNHLFRKANIFYIYIKYVYKKTCLPRHWYKQTNPRKKLYHQREDQFGRLLIDRLLKHVIIVQSLRKETGFADRRISKV